MTDLRWACGMRWSYTHRAWVGFFAQLPDGRAYLRHEMTFREKSPEYAAADILAKAKALDIDITYIAANPELWPDKSKGATGEFVAETLSRAGLPMIRGTKDRVNRWSRLRSWLEVKSWPDPAKPSETITSPSLIIHPSCVVLLRTLPTLVSAKTDPDDIDETPDEYPAAGVSYYAMSRPMPSADDEPELPDGAIGHSLRELRDSLSHG